MGFFKTILSKTALQHKESPTVRTRILMRSKKHDLDKEMEVSLDLILQAREIAMYWYGRANEQTKPGNEPVTEADKQIDEFLVSGLSGHFPDDEIVAEESGARAGGAKKNARRWCIDPIDGTREFISGIGEFAIMIGLAKADQAVFGAILLPAKDLLYWGGPSLGAYKKDLSCGLTFELSVSDVSRPEDMTMAVSRSHRTNAVDSAAGILGIKNEIRSGSVGVKLGMVSSRDADLYLHPASGTRLWDACAPDAIVQGAGGKLTDCRGRPIPYQSNDFVNRAGLVASNGLCHAEIIQALAPIVVSESL